MAKKNIAIPDPRTIEPDLFERAGFYAEWTEEEILAQRKANFEERLAAAKATAKEEKVKGTPLEEALIKKADLEDKLAETQKKLDAINKKIEKLIAESAEE